MKKSNNNTIVKLTAVAGAAVVLSCAAIKAHMIKYNTSNTGSFDNPVIEVDTSTSTASMPEAFVAVAATSTYDNIPVIDDEDDSDLVSRLESIHDSDDSDSESLTDYVVSESEQSIDCTVWYSPDWYQDTRMSYMDYRTITDPDSEQWALQ